MTAVVGPVTRGELEAFASGCLVQSPTMRDMVGHGLALLAPWGWRHEELAEMERTAWRCEWDEWAEPLTDERGALTRNGLEAAFNRLGVGSGFPPPFPLLKVGRWVLRPPRITADTPGAYAWRTVSYARWP